MIYHSTKTEFSPCNYNELLALFAGKISLEAYLFKDPNSMQLIKQALVEGHLQESSLDSGARNVLFMTKLGQEYWQSTK